MAHVRVLMMSLVLILLLVLHSTGLPVDYTRYTGGGISSNDLVIDASSSKVYFSKAFHVNANAEQMVVMYLDHDTPDFNAVLAVENNYNYPGLGFYYWNNTAQAYHLSVAFSKYGDVFYHDGGLQAQNEYWLLTVKGEDFELGGADDQVQSSFCAPRSASSVVKNLRMDAVPATEKWHNGMRRAPRELRDDEDVYFEYDLHSLSRHFPAAVGRKMASPSIRSDGRIVDDGEEATNKESVFVNIDRLIGLLMATNKELVVEVESMRSRISRLEEMLGLPPEIPSEEESEDRAADM
eukprot:TRINITY_DN4953_c0_g1_i2.p1 TRINITY_DN4953_c0_g1~~TRINITY_DN4953_c0_g1_i2.p1  ORF type:complete len:294 (+),score=61.46 TRINITY_DN4953_c0_g1_i2:114-995(+)